MRFGPHVDRGEPCGGLSWPAVGKLPIGGVNCYSLSMEGFFRFVEEPLRSELLDGARREQFAAEQVILAEGQQRRAIFLIRNGVVRIERGHMGFSVQLSRLGAGEIFGEMSFVEDFGASASVVAAEPTEIAIIDEAHVSELRARDPKFCGQFYQSLAEILSRRLRETTVRGIAEYSWGGAAESTLPLPTSHDDWGGGSPLREPIPESDSLGET
jgi:hypothetical protein